MALIQGLAKRMVSLCLRALVREEAGVYSRVTLSWEKAIRHTWTLSSMRQGMLGDYRSTSLDHRVVLLTRESIYTL